MPTTPKKREYQRDRMARLYSEAPGRILAIQHAGGIPCRGCGTPRKVNPKDRARTLAEGGPLCRKCRRDERLRQTAALARLREERLGRQAARVTTRPKGKGSGRSGTGNSAYRRARLAVLEASDICGICGHGGALTTDHIVSDRHWLRDLLGRRVPGFDEVANLQPAHGSMGSSGAVNRCGECGKLCNQSKGSRV